MTGKASVRIRGLTLHPGGAESPVVDRFYSDVLEGRLLVLAGPGGAGKTAILRLLATLEAPTAGTADIAGADLRDDPVGVRERIGWLPAGTLGPDRASPRALVSRELRIRGWAKEEASARAHEVLGAVGLRTDGDLPLALLAPGARRRALFARAIAHDPPVLLLDEPLAELDLVEREVAWAVLRAARRSGRCIVAATRFPAGIEAVADAVAVLRDGRCLGRGACAEVKERTRAPSLEEAVLRVLAADGLPGAQEAIDARALPEPPPAAMPEPPPAATPETPAQEQGPPPAAPPPAPPSSG